MTSTYRLLAVGFVAILCAMPIRPTAAAEPAWELVDYVNPLIGTDNVATQYRSIWVDRPTEYGGMWPGVTHPFGMMQWMPMTRKNEISVTSYHYGDPCIHGFIGSRQPAIWMGDYGQVTIMPGAGKVAVDWEKRKLPYRHADEVSTPYYYAVTMNQGTPESIKVELSATSRAAILVFRYSKKADAEPYLVIDASREYSKAKFPDKTPAEGWIKIEPEKQEVVGYNADRLRRELGPLALPNFRGYFVIQFDTPFFSAGTYLGADMKMSEGTLEARGDQVGGYVRFAPGKNGVVQARVGTSLISLEQARANLNREIPDWDLARTKAESRKLWNRQLSKILVEGQDEDAKAVFYTAMYHSHLYPREQSEGGQYYSAFDDKVHEGVQYNDYSLWDTFRGEHPLLTLTAPERVGDMITGMLHMYQEGGWLEKWPNPSYTGVMIGSPTDSVIADAWVKGLRNFDLKLAYEAVRKNAMVPQQGDETNRWDNPPNPPFPETRGGLSWYKKLGYVPDDHTSESCSRTLEFAYDDFCDAVLAKAVGNMDDYAMFMARSKNYRNVIKDGQLWARTTDGKWIRPPEGAVTEGDPWTYLFCAMQDVPGLIEAMGGNEAFIKKLDEAFDKGHARHDNEPGHHYPYLYDYAGQPWRTQQRVREVARTNYRNAPGGLSGNEDCGQMSAWYILSSMGFYSVTPGTELYAIGSPMWDSVTISIGAPYAPATFRITAENQSRENQYVQSATLNGVPLNTPFLKHSDIVRGGELHFVMGPKPNRNWGTGKVPDR